MTKNTEIEKKLKRVQWIRTVINHHLDDVEDILLSVLKEHNGKEHIATLPKHCCGWDTYQEVINNLSKKEQDPKGFANKVGKLVFAMSRHNISREEAQRFVDELNINNNTTRQYIQQHLDNCYSKKQSTTPIPPIPCEVDDSDLFGGDLGMP